MLETARTSNVLTHRRWELELLRHLEAHEPVDLALDHLRLEERRLEQVGQHGQVTELRPDVAFSIVVTRWHAPQHQAKADHRGTRHASTMR